MAGATITIVSDLVGTAAPEEPLFEDSPANPIRIADLGKKVALFFIPGAFTPTCSVSHLPGFIAHFDRIKAAGVDAVVCASVNDPFVMKAFGEASGAAGKIRFLADTTGKFNAELGTLFDATPALGNMRARRSSMLIEDGKITWAFVEPTGGFTKSDAGTFLREALGVTDAPALEVDPKSE